MCVNNYTEKRVSSQRYNFNYTVVRLAANVINNNLIIIETNNNG